MNDLQSKANELKQSYEDAKLAKSVSEHVTNEQLIDLLHEIAERSDTHHQELQDLATRFQKIEQGNPRYSGPHPLQAVRIPSEEEVRRINALVAANRITTIKVPPQLAGRIA